ncbi:hypothetical protein BKA93DRAFT_750792 [Sparassis latifolia]
MSDPDAGRSDPQIRPTSETNWTVASMSDPVHYASHSDRDPQIHASRPLMISRNELETSDGHSLQVVTLCTFSAPLMKKLQSWLENIANAIGDLSRLLRGKELNTATVDSEVESKEEDGNDDVHEAEAAHEES